MKFEAYSTVDRGLEDLAIMDLKERHGIEAKYRGFMGKIFYNATAEDIIKLNLSARSINRVIIKIGEHKITNLDDVYKYIKKLDLTEYINPEQTFAVRPNRIGTKKFTSLDIARVSGKAIIDSYLEDTSHKLKVNLDNPDVEFYAEVINDNLIFGIDTTGLSLHIRRYRKFNHPMPIKTTIGYLLVKASNWDKKTSLLDPTCGSGTILIEAAHLMRNIPICRFRSLEEYSMVKLKFFDKDEIKETCEHLLDSMNQNKYAPLIGVEKNKDFYKGALDNIKNAFVDDTVNIINGDATRLKEFIKEEINFIANNPPYKLPNRREIVDFYSKYLKSIDSILAKNGRASMVTTEKKLIDKHIKETNLVILHERKIPYGSLTVYFLILKKQ